MVNLGLGSVLDCCFLVWSFNHCTLTCTGYSQTAFSLNRRTALHSWLMFRRRHQPRMKDRRLVVDSYYFNVFVFAANGPPNRLAVLCEDSSLELYSYDLSMLVNAEIVF